jgi:hypothetical protein
VVSLRSFAVLVLEIDPEEEVDHASGVGRRGEAEEGVLDSGVLRAKEDGLEVSRRLGFVRRRVKFAMQCRLPSRSFPVPRESDKSIQGRSV